MFFLSYQLSVFSCQCSVVSIQLSVFMYRKNKVSLIRTRCGLPSFRLTTYRNDEEINCSVFLPAGHHVQLLIFVLTTEHWQLNTDTGNTHLKIYIIFSNPFTEFLADLSIFCNIYYLRVFRNPEPLNLWTRNLEQWPTKSHTLKIFLSQDQKMR